MKYGCATDTSHNCPYAAITAAFAKKLRLFQAVFWLKPGEGNKNRGKKPNSEQLDILSPNLSIF